MAVGCGGQVGLLPCVPRNPAASLFQLKHLGKSSSDTVYEFFLPQIQRSFCYAKCLPQNPEASVLQLLLVCFGLSFTLAKPTLQTISSFGSLFKLQQDLICVTLESVRYCFASEQLRDQKSLLTFGETTACQPAV